MELDVYLQTLEDIIVQLDEFRRTSFEDRTLFSVVDAQKIMIKLLEIDRLTLIIRNAFTPSV